MHAPRLLSLVLQVGVSEGRLRKWLLSISAFLRTQNGSVAEAISLWKRNVDKEFEGREDKCISPGMYPEEWAVVELSGTERRGCSERLYTQIERCWVSFCT